MKVYKIVAISHCYDNEETYLVHQENASFLAVQNSSLE